VAGGFIGNGDFATSTGGCELLSLGGAMSLLRAEDEVAGPFQHRAIRPDSPPAPEEGAGTPAC